MNLDRKFYGEVYSASLHRSVSRVDQFEANRSIRKPQRQVSSFEAHLLPLPPFDRKSWASSPSNICKCFATTRAERAIHVPEIHLGSQKRACTSRGFYARKKHTAVSFRLRKTGFHRPLRTRAAALNTGNTRASEYNVWITCLLKHDFSFADQGKTSSWNFGNFSAKVLGPCVFDIISSTSIKKQKLYKNGIYVDLMTSSGFKFLDSAINIDSYIYSAWVLDIVFNWMWSTWKAWRMRCVHLAKRIVL